MGEGTRVIFAAFVLRADTSNQGIGEAVNCNKSGILRNDIHIHLGPSKSKEPSNFCKAVVAEIIPHQRPDAFSAGNLQLTNNIVGREHPVRVTGQLFYDGNHPVRCDLGEPASSRAGKWEIHPIYKVEVCKFKSLTTCDARNDAKWKDLKTWIEEQEEGPDP